MAVCPRQRDRTAMKVCRLALTMALTLAACAGTPTPDWQINASGSLQRATDAYLSAAMAALQRDSNLPARAPNWRAPAAPISLARGELMHCAAQRGESRERRERDLCRLSGAGAGCCAARASLMHATSQGKRRPADVGTAAHTTAGSGRQSRVDARWRACRHRRPVLAPGCRRRALAPGSCHRRRHHAGGGYRGRTGLATTAAGLAAGTAAARAGARRQRGSSASATTHRPGARSGALT
jgi:hypothetical protein